MPHEGDVASANRDADRWETSEYVRERRGNNRGRDAAVGEVSGGRSTVVMELSARREEATVHRDQTMDDVRPYDVGEGLAAMRREETQYETFGSGQALPTVSVVIAALNEAQNLEHVLPRRPGRRL